MIHKSFSTYNIREIVIKFIIIFAKRNNLVFYIFFDMCKF